MEIIIPGSESVHVAKDVSQLATRPRERSSTLLVPAGDRPEAEARLVEAILTNLGLDRLSGWIDPSTGDYELLAPPGHEFVMTGQFMVWESEYGPPSYSEALWGKERADNLADHWDEEEDEEPEAVSHFSGPRISLSLGHQNVNRRQSSSRSKWFQRSTHTSTDSDRPEVRVQVKDAPDVTVAIGRLTTLPFNLEGRAEPIQVPLPDPEVLLHTRHAEGCYETVTISLVPATPPRGIAVPQTVSATDPDKLWLPYTTQGQTFEEFAAEYPATADYMVWRIGSRQAVVDYHRRVYSTPFKDDPLWRAKDLMWGDYSMATVHEHVARIIARMSESEMRTRATAIFRLAGGKTVLIETIEAEHGGYADEEPF